MDTVNMFLSGAVFGLLVGGILGIAISNLINADES